MRVAFDYYQLYTYISDAGGNPSSARIFMDYSVTSTQHQPGPGLPTSGPIIGGFTNSVKIFSDVIKQ